MKKDSDYEIILQLLDNKIASLSQKSAINKETKDKLIKILKLREKLYLNDEKVTKEVLRQYKKYLK